MNALPAAIDILRVSLLTILSIIFSPRKHPARTWSTEFTFRLAKRLVSESVGKPIPWLRDRQNLLKLVTPEMFSVSSHTIKIEGVPCLVINPKTATHAAQTILYIHGGGYCVGSAAGYLSTMAKIAEKCNAKVIGIDYRLCPEHAIPAAQEDCVAVAEHFVRSKASDHQLVLMGDSAGGALCLETLNALANAGIEKDIDAAVLISPWLEPLDNAVLETENEKSDILDHAITGHWKNNFYQSPEQELFLSLGNIELNKLPKLYIQAAESEVFIKQVRTFIERLKAEKHDFQYKIFDGQFHVFQTFAPLVREADGAIQQIADYLSEEGR